MSDEPLPTSAPPAADDEKASLVFAAPADGFELVVVERSFEQPVTFESLQELEARFSWCLEQKQVTALGSYVSGDGRRMICIYQARDAESVREVNRTSGVPFDRVWTARHVTG